MSKPHRIRSTAAEFVPANRAEADEAIRTIGEYQRRREALQTAMNERLAALKAESECEAAPLSAAIKTLSQGVQTWAEANRAELLKGGGKTVKLGKGEIPWRMRPPSVVVRGAAAVIEALTRLGLQRFLRVKTEVDKERILADPDAVRDVKGITVSQGEDFVIVPFATSLEEVA